MFVRCYRDSTPIVCIMCFFLTHYVKEWSYMLCRKLDQGQTYTVQVSYDTSQRLMSSNVGSGKPPTPYKERHTRTVGHLDTSEGSVQPLSAHPSGIVLWEACPQICKLHHHRIKDVLHERKLALEVLNTIAQVGEVLQRVIASAGGFQRQCPDR